MQTALTFCLLPLLFIGAHCTGERKDSKLDEKKEFKLHEPTKGLLVGEKAEELFLSKNVEYFLKNENVIREKECFAKIRHESIDFVIDLAPSPSMDAVDKQCAESPLALYLEGRYRTASKAYFGVLQLFIDFVTYGMKPDICHSIIFEGGHKYFIRGESLKESSKPVSEFNDIMRNLKTLWPASTKEVQSHLGSVLENNLGLLTKLALWNRNNGLPTVMRDSKRSKALYTIVISDGASKAKIHDLTDDLSRTTVIDIGNHRFVKNMAWDDMKQLFSVYTLPTPQSLAMLVDVTRLSACRLVDALKH